MGIVGALGVGAIYIFSKVGGLGIGDFFSGLLGGGRIGEATREIKVQSGIIVGLTEQIEAMHARFQEQTSEIQTRLDVVQELATARMGEISMLEQMMTTLQTQRTEREISQVIKGADPSSKLRELNIRQPRTLEWLARTMPYSVGLP